MDRNHCRAKCVVYCPLKSTATSLVGADFNTTSVTITIPAGTKEEFEIPNRFFFDDNINEIDQSFALVGVLGNDIPDDFACFQRRTGGPMLWKNWWNHY